jgi:hypothetical protein
MASTSGITTANGAFLEMALQNVAPRESVTTKYTHVRSVSSVCSKLDLLNTGRTFKLTSKEVALEMFSMEVSLGAVRTGEFSISILGRY